MQPLRKETTGPRVRRTDDELRLERDFQAVADRVLAAGETDDPRELEDRTDQALFNVVGLRSVETLKRSKRGTRTGSPTIATGRPSCCVQSLAGRRDPEARATTRWNAPTTSSGRPIRMNSAPTLLRAHTYLGSKSIALLGTAIVQTSDGSTETASTTRLTAASGTLVS